ncbi:SDR family oxidoreductase [Natronolimnobius sp. AArcel1]|uniref:SDR family NAD(P)-dependent oxidoreductase n=1 Tax=Natronolimnobius sp. AArcel1 TaxID=1679093 RepID=UPI0013EB7CB4|nr:SDR family oxidoreductase [Natronolimnobius sp. AArcel1]NGM70498.1 SDR family oxidoreductase [Natronolimnobius sp. AArcel1]
MSIINSTQHDGRTVIITGGSSGIGRGIALAFAEAGSNVVIADVTREPRQGERYETDVTRPTDEVAREEFDVDATYLETDVSDPDAVEAMIDMTLEEYGRIDVVVNNAGIFIEGDSQDLTVEEWDTVTGVNLDGSFFCAKYAIPHLKEHNGVILNVGSVNSQEGGGGPPYASSKAGIVNLTRDLAVELGDDEVNVNAICPGFIETAIQDYQTDESLEQQLGHTLLPRAGTPEDVGTLAVFLASDEASFIHGEEIYIDGGWTAHSL